MEIQVIEKTNGRINRATGTTIKERLRVCAYCRVSTAGEEQLNSYQSQLKYYDEKINSKSEWQFAGIYADEAISGTLDFKRTNFMKMIQDSMEGKINKEQYTEKFDNLNVDLLKIEQKIEDLLKETNRTESIKQRLNKFKSLFKTIDIMSKFDKDVFECLIDKVVIGETLEDGTINPYTIRFICKNGTEINCKDKFTN